MKTLMVCAFAAISMTIFPGLLHASDVKHPLVSLETRFSEATDVLNDLLMPNSMARNKPRTKQEVRDLVVHFESLSAAIKDTPDLSIPFLAAKVQSKSKNDEAAAICALQLLFEINTESSLRVINEAQTHPNKLLAEKAKIMIHDNEDILWGFRGIGR